MLSQVCSCCQAEKPVAEFYLHSDGRPRKQCKLCRNSRNAKWKREHPDKAYKLSEEAYQKSLVRTQEWRKANLAYDAARAQAYRTRKLNQMPPWADAEVIFQFYDNCPEGYHVDHIVPLKGKTVRGFHVINNLQYLPARENIRKGNRYE